jgi:N-acyl-D-aspartate/D-glutamate deacylase
MVKERCLLTLEEAIHKACYLPLQEIAKVKDRGVIREGAYADVILFNYDKIRMTGTFSEPTLPTDGMEYVLVNGQVAYEDKQHTGVKSGQVLRHS